MVGELFEPTPAAALPPASSLPPSALRCSAEMGPGGGPGEPGSSGGMELPEPELANLAAISRALGEVSLFQRDRIAQQLVARVGYLSKLLELFRVRSAALAAAVLWFGVHRFAVHCFAMMCCCMRRCGVLLPAGQATQSRWVAVPACLPGHVVCDCTAPAVLPADV